MSDDRAWPLLDELDCAGGVAAGPAGLRRGAGNRALDGEDTLMGIIDPRLRDELLRMGYVARPHLDLAIAAVRDGRVL